uniref:Myotilin n=1 Tax=Cynoglossus semilaevis TaxID=244447 RepID=A0A3P8X3U0_CYNSE
MNQIQSQFTAQTGHQNQTNGLVKSSPSSGLSSPVPSSSSSTSALFTPVVCTSSSSAPRTTVRSTITLTPNVPSATGLGSATLPANQDGMSAPAAYLCSVLPSQNAFPFSSSKLSPNSSLPPPSVLPKPILKKSVAPRPSSSRSTDEDIQGSKDALIQDLEKKLRRLWSFGQKLSYEERMARRLLGPDNVSTVFDQDRDNKDIVLEHTHSRAHTHVHTLTVWGRHHSGTDERGNEGSAIQEKCYAPRFLQIPPDLTVEEGRFCRVDFEVGGLPTPDVCWYLDGKAIRPDDYHKMLVCEKGLHSFIIEIVTVHHAGVYECVAKNRAGESRFSMRLDVIAQELLRPPTFVQKMSNSRALEGDTVRLECKVDASPPPQLFWKKDKDMMRLDPTRMSLYQDGSGRQCLLIERVLKSDAGWYTLSAINEAGMSTCNARLDVSVPNPAPRTEHKIKPCRRFLLEKKLLTMMLS